MMEHAYGYMHQCTWVCCIMCILPLNVYVYVHMYTLVRQGLTCATTDAFVRVYTFIHKCVYCYFPVCIFYILYINQSINI